MQKRWYEAGQKQQKRRIPGSESRQSAPGDPQIALSGRDVNLHRDFMRFFAGILGIILRLKETFMTILLANRTWYTIRLAALAHGLRFNTRQTREQGHDFLRRALIEGGGLAKAYHSLAQHEREPLLALQAAAGYLPLHEFTARFGGIRPYKPWRNGTSLSDRQPWKRPISPAEKLWHLGLVEIVRGGRGRPDVVALPEEVADLLPPPPRPLPHPSDVPAAARPPAREAALRDLAALVAGLLAGCHPDSDISGFGG